MANKSIAFTNLETGEVIDTGLKQKDTKHIIKGHKMYNNGLIHMIDILTKDEMKRVVTMFDATTIDYYNILTLPFHKLTSDMSKAARSRFRKKLIEGEILAIYNNKMMLNPYIFIPRGDRNILNCNNLTQRAWKYLFVDTDKGSEEIDKHIEFIFNIDLQPNYIKVGSNQDSKYIELPKGD